MPQKIENLEFRVLLTSPEMLFTKTNFSKLAHTPSFMSHVILIVADEAHCITRWSGKAFRPLFAQLGSLRSLVELKVPILAVSATMSPEVVDAVKNSLAMRSRQTFDLNLGNNCKNITHIVVKIKSATDFEALRIFVEVTAGEGQLISTLVYVLNKDNAREIALYLKNLLPLDSPLRSQIDFANSARDPAARAKAIQAFWEGIVNILVATEVAGMVCTVLFALLMLTNTQGLDMRDIVRIIHVGIEETLEENVQHYGRCGRDGRPAYSVTMVPKSFFAPPKPGAKPENVQGHAAESHESQALQKPLNIASESPESQECVDELPKSQNSFVELPDSQESLGEASQPLDIIAQPTESATILDSSRPLEDSGPQKDEAEAYEDDEQDSEEDSEEDDDDEFELEDPFEGYCEGDAEAPLSTDSSADDAGTGKKKYKTRNIQKAMREYALAKGCRRTIIDAYFKNPPSQEGM